MGTNIIQIADYLVPSYRRTHRLAGAAASGSPDPATPPPGDAAAALARRRVARPTATVGHQSPAPATPLRPELVPVVRTAHSSETRIRGHSGRLRISGRLSDVCAELERLAAAEAATAAQPRRA